jgi:hypothetical protein
MNIVRMFFTTSGAVVGIRMMDDYYGGYSAEESAHAEIQRQRPAPQLEPELEYEEPSDSNEPRNDVQAAAGGLTQTPLEY